MRTAPVVLSAALAFPLIAHAGFSVSSFKAASSRDAVAFDAAAALDGKLETAWQVDPEQDNVGQWIEIDVPNGKVDRISAVVGWAENDKRFGDHARIKKARVEVFSKAGGVRTAVLEQVVTFEDKQARQVIDLPDVAVGDELDGGAVRLTVLEVWPGKDYDNLAVSEVLVHMVEFDAHTRNVVSVSSGNGDALVDANAKTLWIADASDAEPSFTVSAGKYSASSLGITTAGAEYARPKKIQISQSDAVRVYDLPEKPGTHWVELPALFGYTGSNFGDVTVKVLETWPGTKQSTVAVADVRFKATALEPF